MKNSRNIFEVFFWTIAVLLVAKGLWLKVSTATTFWNDVHSNFLGSFLAVLIGIPVVLFTNDAFHRKVKLQENKQKAKKSVEIISLLKEELDWNNKRLQERITSKNSGKAVLQTDKFKNDFFNAIQSSGQIEYIDNPTLLNRIVSVYFVLNILKSMEDLCYQTMRTSSLYFGDKTAGQVTLEDSYAYYNLLSSSLVETFKEIDSYFAANNLQIK